MIWDWTPVSRTISERSNHHANVWLVDRLKETTLPQVAFLLLLNISILIRDNHYNTSTIWLLFEEQ